MRTPWPLRPAPTPGLAESAAYLARASSPPPAVTRALGELLATRFASAGASPSGSSASAAFDALLHAGRTALDCGQPALALELADSALGRRRASRAAWRLRAGALEALGRATQAVEAYERHRALTPRGDPAAAYTALLERRRLLLEAAELAPGSAFAAAVHEELPPEEVHAAFTDRLTAALREHGAAVPEVRRLARLYAAYRLIVAHGRMADPALAGTAPLSAGDLRNRLAGRPVALVAPGGPTPPEDGSLVLRCGSFRADERADGHVTTVAAGTKCLDRPVAYRIILGEDLTAWREALRTAVPGAQRYLGDESLRRPLTDPALLAGGAPAAPAVTMALLLDFLDATPHVRLYGSERLTAADRDRLKETRTVLR
ncbi:hypothetical protein ACFQLX_21590 [Streptomyces polyrhachis]|uniref:Tetratricopeptide repeat protein n=1 Tax=Streptomyces polyrhachis TaxID=1282885 RepID=A0ABW2GKN7_9ACTN